MSKKATKYLELIERLDKLTEQFKKDFDYVQIPLTDEEKKALSIDKSHFDQLGINPVDILILSSNLENIIDGLYQKSLTFFQNIGLYIEKEECKHIYAEYYYTNNIILFSDIIKTELKKPKSHISRIRVIFTFGLLLGTLQSASISDFSNYIHDFYNLFEKFVNIE